VYLRLFYEADIAPEIGVDMLVVSIAKEFHWTLDYIRSLSIEDSTKLQGILEGFNRYEQKMARRKG
jgi:hypothetical protein